MKNRVIHDAITRVGGRHRVSRLALALGRYRAHGAGFPGAPSRHGAR